MSGFLSDRSDWEIKNEKNKMHVRWLLIVLVGGYFSYLLYYGIKGFDSELFNWTFVGTVTGSLAAVNFLVSWELSRARKKGSLPRIVKYLTMIIDFIAISLILLPTGGEKSIFFVVYFIVIVSNAIRYGMKVAVAGVFAFNFCYMGVLIFLYFPYVTMPDIRTEVLKVVGFWLVGIYTGYLARRFQILQGEVEKYELLVKRLMARKD